MSTEPKTQQAEPRSESNAEPRTGAPKQDNPFASFDPLAYWATAQQVFQRLTADAQSRAQAFAEQYGALEAQLMQRAQGAVATWAQLTQDAFAYGAQLSAEARKLSLEAYRRASTGA
jgi:hypothetical protein